MVLIRLAVYLAGGPYRAVFEQVLDEVQMDRMTPAPSSLPLQSSTRATASPSAGPSEASGAGAGVGTFLPLLAPSPNRAAGLGENQDKFVLSPAPTAPLTFELMNFFGKLVGM